MRVLDHIEQVGRYAHDRRVHAGATAAFVVVNGIGYAFGGIEFVQGWGGGLAAAIATAYLVWKSQGYWAWMMVNAALWCALFFDAGLPLLGWLQVALFVFAGYGMTQWALVRLRIGWSPNVPSDLVGAVLGLAVLAYAVHAYRGLEGYTGLGLVDARGHERRARHHRDVARRLPLPRELVRVVAVEPLLLAGRVPRQAVGPVLHDVPLPGDQRRGGVPVESGPAPARAQARRSTGVT